MLSLVPRPQPPREGGVWARDYAVLCLPADFGLPFGRELGVALSLSPTLSMLLAFQHTLQFLVGRYNQ